MAFPWPREASGSRNYLEYWLEEVAKPSVRGTTYAKYETFVRLYLMPGLGRKSLEKLTAADLRTFLNTQRESGQSPHKLRAMHAFLRTLHAAFVLLITLGLRRGEVVGLGWEHVDLEAGTVRIRRELERVGGELRPP